MTDASELSRREMIAATAAALVTPLLPAAPVVAQHPARFLTPAEFALLDELTELIIPTDEHSPGARAAGVAGYIDGRLAEYDPAIPVLKADRERWKAGLATVDALAREASGKAFLEATPAERTALLERMARPLVEAEIPTEEPEERRQPATEKPETVGQRFFVELKSWTARGYYTSKIGIHDEMEYKGNRAILEFSGTDVATLPPGRPPQD